MGRARESFTNEVLEGVARHDYQLNLYFKDRVSQSEMRYIGSKVSTAPQIFRIVKDRVADGLFCDPFGGIGVVGSYFKSRGFTVFSGDILMFAHFFQIARIEANSAPTFKELRNKLKFKSAARIVDLLNNERINDGLLVNEYSDKRNFFTRDNATRIEACRQLILEWSKNEWISSSERAILLASLINSMDRVANTAGTYYAYLKKWHRKALLPFRFELLSHTKGSPYCHCYFGEAKNLVASRPFDVLYLDPPYNERCYTQYYHLPETIALQETPSIHGKSGVPDTRRVTSDLNKPSRARKALEELLEKARFRLLVFHYSDNGLITSEELKKIFSCYGIIEEHILRSKGYTTSKGSRATKHRLYLIHNG